MVTIFRLGTCMEGCESLCSDEQDEIFTIIPIEGTNYMLWLCCIFRVYSVYDLYIQRLTSK